MAMKKKLIIGIFVLAIMLVPLASASENVNKATKDNEAKSFHFSTDNSTLIASFWGKDMTIAEFMEKVDPGYLETLPKDIVKNLQKQKMSWKTPEEAKSIVQPRDLIARFGPYGLGYSSLIIPASVKVDFCGTTQVVIPSRTTTIPYMHILSQLYVDGGTTPVAVATDAEYLSSFAGGYGTYNKPSFLPRNYHLVTEHYSILPAGCTPQTGRGITTCDVYA